jgi:choline dehydrogenase-like flavoprotein
MIRNGKDIGNGTVISKQVCVIGSGPAGVTAAWHLQKAGLTVVLIEGSRDFIGKPLEDSWPDKVKLYNGTADGLFKDNNIEPEFLVLPYARQQSPSERERVYGGTSAHWGGQSRPLDPVDFEARPGFPGWPITRADLEPYYVKAAAFCNLYPDFSAEYWARVLNAEVPHLDGFDASMYQFMGGDLNFSSRKFDGTNAIGDTSVEVILNASLLEIVHAQGSVRSLTVASMNDQSQKATQFTIQAEIFVLACGAVANARQLLLSNAGNEHDQVGRYFMCHPLSQRVYVSGYKFLTPAEMRLMNGQGLAGSRENPLRDPNINGVQGRFQPTAGKQKELGIGGCWFWSQSGQYYFEMAPNPESRVRLADTRDPVFDQPQTHITWLLSDRDPETFKQTCALFNSAVTARGGFTSLPDWETVKEALVVNGHHIGTTRMSSDPAKGVVDANQKVHSLDNLYVAGSSVFASAGVSNPTFTIVTLSIRLAEHLARNLA